jgi:hypothetical protein
VRSSAFSSPLRRQLGIAQIIGTRGLPGMTSPSRRNLRFPPASGRVEALPLVGLVCSHASPTPIPKDPARGQDVRLPRSQAGSSQAPPGSSGLAGPTSAASGPRHGSSRSASINAHDRQWL